MLSTMTQSHLPANMSVHPITFETTTSEFENEIIQKSQEEHIILATPRDAHERFVSHDSFLKWWTKGRVIYRLHDGGETAGMIWFSLPVDRNGLYIPATFAIRLYEGAVGQGLAIPFMYSAHDHFLAEYGPQQIWLGVKRSNVPAIHTYKKFGYEMLAEHTEDMTMLYDGDKYEVERT